MQGGSCQREVLVCMNNKELHLKNGFIICLLRLSSFIPELLQCLHAASPPLPPSHVGCCLSCQRLLVVHSFCVCDNVLCMALELPFKQSCD